MKTSFAIGAAIAVLGVILILGTIFSGYGCECPA